MKRNQIILIIVVGLFILSLIYFGGQNRENYVPAASKLEPQINSEGGVSIEVALLNFSYDKPLQFEISLNTHQGDLNFDMAKISALIDDKGNQFQPIEWQGGSGGHHLSGRLIFPILSKEVKKIKLIIRDIYGVKNREFNWNLK